MTEKGEGRVQVKLKKQNKKVTTFLLLALRNESKITM